MTRDAVLGQPICAHCGLTVDTMPGLRNHINRRACKKFDPDATHTPIPPTAEIREALTRGTVPQILASPMERTRWTLQCQCCGMSFTTQVNSYRHLTEEHLELLNQAWPHIQQLHAQLRLFGACLCNPGPARLLDNVHSCLPLIQMGMQYVRLRQMDQISLLLPCPFSEGNVSRGIARDVEADILSLMHYHLPARDVTQFWTLPALLEALRERCLVCPVRDQQDGLAMHLRDKHCQALTGLTALTTQIYNVTRRSSHGNSAPACPLCRLPDCSAQTCTVAHNIAVVITGVADGHGLSGNDAIPGDLPPPDTGSPDTGERGQGGGHTVAYVGAWLIHSQATNHEPYQKCRPAKNFIFKQTRRVSGAKTLQQKPSQFHQKADPVLGSKKRALFVWGSVFYVDIARYSFSNMEPKKGVHFSTSKLGFLFVVFLLLLLHFCA